MFSFINHSIRYECIIIVNNYFHNQKYIEITNDVMDTRLNSNVNLYGDTNQILMRLDCDILM